MSSISRRHRSNYSLWPEQARPRRALPLTLAAGGFAIGIVCAVAAHNVVTDFTRPSAAPEPVRQTAVAPTPIYAAPAPAAAASEPVEPANRKSSRPSVAKMTLPSIGTVTAMPSATTDGRGSTDGRGGDALSGGTATPSLATPPSAGPSVTGEQATATTAEQPAATAAPPPKAERKHVRRVVKRTRHPTNYGYYRSRQPFYGFGSPAYRGYGQIYARQQYYY